MTNGDRDLSEEQHRAKVFGWSLAAFALVVGATLVVVLRLVLYVATHYGAS